MTNIIRPESGDTKWAIVSHADKLFTSKGEKKLRVDMKMLFGLPGEKGKQMEQMDKTHHLAVALVDNKIREHKTDKPLVAGFRKVAVKIGSTGEDDDAKDKYIIMNINSLAKRLGVDKEEIKEREKTGSVHVLIQERLKEMVTTQEKISGILSETTKWMAEEKEAFRFENQEDKDCFIKFIKQHFDDEELHRRAEEFINLEFNANLKGTVQEFVEMLAPKIWWDSDVLPTIHEKVALTQANLNAQNVTQYVRVSFDKAFERVDRPVEEDRHLNFFDWDKENKYAIRVGDYVYIEKPASYPKDEVPLKLQDKGGEDKWVLVNVRDLEKKFGLTKQEIHEENENSNNNLMDKLNVKLAVIVSYNDKIQKIVNREDTDSFIEKMKEVFEGHPNKEVRDVVSLLLQNFLKVIDNLSLNTSITADQRTQKREEILFQTVHALEQKLGAIGALGGNGHIPDTFRGEALSRKGMSGKAANRYRLIDWDVKGRYAPQLREETYLTKPTDLASNEVALMFRRSKNSRSEWYVFNKFSLKGRLGLSEKELNRCRDFSEIIQKKSAIERFNLQFEHDFGREDLTADKYKDLLDAAIREHPDSEVKAVLQEAKRSLAESENNRKGANPGIGYISVNPDIDIDEGLPSEVNALRQKLVEMGALSVDRRAF